MTSHIHILTLNCWGLKFISDHRNARLAHIGTAIANLSPTPDIVGLQECWTQEDYEAIRTRTSHILPHGKFYFSGAFGGGLAILSRWPIVESTMQRYTLNGRPTAFFRGDWYVGKGIACAVVKMDDGELAEVFCTHLHAPYEREPNDSYLCHRTSQAWEVSKLLSSARAKGRLAVALGDFNMIPLSLAHQLITTHGPAIDTWRALHPFSSIGSAIDEPEMARGLEIPDAKFNLTENGATCDSVLNTWRWTDEQRKRLKKGETVDIPLNTEDSRAKRLDYVFIGGKTSDWKVTAATVGMVERHPDIQVSLSDHFSVEVTIERTKPPAEAQVIAQSQKADEFLPLETYDAILDVTEAYILRERGQRRSRIAHFFFSVGITIACLVAVWWSPRNFVSFILILLSSLSLTAGTVDGLIGLLFMSWELRCLKEFRWEMENLRQHARTEIELKSAR
ncbi:DNase I-like protein [Microthyrium microscopicum]|uniref:DNase I-like protein n=1 Tax=Microthyrium microscopicum TaxID=703497 RepID=A0A6A6UI86_9PEZI|nr:DNase I-like protein [Microthyrium microscopicum]